MNNITMIVATDLFYGIGKDKKIPWYIPEDFKHFKSLTEHNVCIMGKTTWEEIVAKFPKGLPNRTTIVVSSTLCEKYGSAFNLPHHELALSNQYFVETIDDAIRFTDLYHVGKQVLFCGGKHIYEDGIRFCNKLYVTRIYKDYECDVRLALDMFDGFEITDNVYNDEKKFSFLTFERKYR